MPFICHLTSQKVTDIELESIGSTDALEEVCSLDCYLFHAASASS